MSDGNIHRALLPSTPYESGLRMGKAIARRRALEAFAELLSQEWPQVAEQEASALTARFAALLSRRLL